ncbi:hypothetical protein AB0I34_12145 [Kribbella sp. NPDC050281]|uniref:hypothetical protein n=1 Tax=Kribbella sp. NPDC050281 TaxID=3155515 RepID=UPI0033D24D2E
MPQSLECAAGNNLTSSALQQYGNRVRKSIASVKLASNGRYAFGIKPAARGTIAYRVWFPGDADHAAVYTPNKFLTIR